MTKQEAEKILLEVIPKLNPTEQTALNLIINGKFDKPDLRVEVIDENHQKFNGEIYTKHKSGYYHVWKTLHKEVMKYYNNGEIPPGCFVHHNKKTADGHWDRDKNNIEDLSIVTEAEHSAIHKERKLVIKPKKLSALYAAKNFLVNFTVGKTDLFFAQKNVKVFGLKIKLKNVFALYVEKLF